MVRQPNTLLAIDPGSDRSAFIVWDGSHVLEKGIVSNSKMLDIIYEGGVDHVAIEMIASYGMPVGAEVFQTCLFIGRYIEAAEASEMPYTLIYRREVKITLCGTSKAKDGNIRQRIIDLLGAPGTKKNPGVTYGMAADMWAALAVALTWQEKQQ